MVEKSCATEVRQLALEVIENFNKMLAISKHGCSTSEYEDFEKVVGIFIGEIQVDILDKLYVEYPDLDDLADD